MGNFNFKGIRFNISGIHDYLESQGVKLSSDEQKNLDSIFLASDTYDNRNNREGSDGELNLMESQKFQEEIKNKMPSLLKHVQDFASGIVDYFAKNKVRKAAEEKNDATVVAVEEPVFAYKITKEIEKQDNKAIQDKVISEAKKYKKNLNQEEVKYWANRISTIAKKYDIPDSLLVSIIGRETHFTKNVNAVNGAGPMGVTTIAVRDFFPKGKKSWNEIYNSMDSELLNDILYKKDAKGNFIKDKSGKYILKYRSPEALRNACAKNDEVGMKVGLLSFEMNFVKAVAQLKYKKATYANVPKTIEGIKNGSIKLSEAQIEHCVTIALKNYNSVFKTYAPAVVDSLKRQGLNFENLYFIK